MYHTLIASDLDGTLLLPGQSSLDPSLFDLIRRLRRKGVLFCAASGRSYGSLKKMFSPVADEIYYLTENSAVIYEGNKLLDTICIPHQIATEIVNSISIRNDCVARVNTDIAHYYITPDEETAAYMRKMEYPDAHTAKTFSEVEGNITQITACSKGDITIPAAHLIPIWEQRIGVAITGEHWLDFTSAGKGIGLQLLCRHLKIDLEHTYAFGDNFNDVSMLEISGHPYIMNSAVPDLLKRFQNHTDNVVRMLLELEKTL